MSIGSLNELQQIKWPYGAVAQVVNGQTTSTTYSYPSTLQPGYYAFSGVSLNGKASSLVLSSASNNTTLRIKSGETQYFQLTTTASDVVFESEGSVPTAETGLIGRMPDAPYSVVYGNGKYIVGVTSSTTFAYISPQIHGAYDTINVGVGSIYTSAYDNGKYVLVGSGSTGGFSSSTDAVTWSVNPLGRGQTWQQVRYLNNLWVAVGSRSNIATSTDAITWTPRSGYPGNTTTCWSMAAGPTFILTGQNSQMTSISTTGVGWQEVDAVLGGTVRTILYSGSLYVIAGSAGAMKTSTDALTWTARTSGFGTTTIHEVNYGNSTYVAVGVSGTMRSSTDAITWSAVTSGFGTSDIITIAHANSLWVAGGGGGALRTSTDLITWNAQTSGFGTSQIQRIKYLNNLWVAVGVGGKLSTSTDGATWTARTSGFGTTTINDVVFYNNYYIAAGVGGTIRYSTDAVTWSTPTWSDAQPASILYQMAPINGRLHVGAAGGVVFSSTDGVSWQQYFNGFAGSTSATAQAVSYGNGVYALGTSSASLAAYSTDGVTWTRNTTAGVTSLDDIVFDGTKFVAVRQGTGFFTSTDAITWTAGTVSANAYIGLLYNNSTYYTWGLTQSANLASSTDAVTWTTRAYRSTTASIYRLIRGDGSFFVATDNEALVPSYSGNLNPTSWTAANLGTLVTSPVASGVIASPTNFVVAGGGVVLYSSVTSPTSWTRVSVAQAGTVYAMAYGNIAGTDVYVGASLTHSFRATNLSTWATVDTTATYDVCFDSFSSQFFVGNDSNQIRYFGTAGIGSTLNLDFMSTTAAVRSVAAKNGWYLFGADSGEVAIGRKYNQASDYAYSKLSGSSIYGVAIGEDVAVALDSDGRLFYLYIDEASFEGQLTVTATGATTEFYNKSWREAFVPYATGVEAGRSVAYNNGTFVALMASGRTYSSTDGATWTLFNTGLPTNVGNYNTIKAYGNNQFVVANSGGAYYTTGGELPSAFSLYQISTPTL